MLEKTEFLPFHAINEFMRPDFRLIVVRETLINQEQLPESLATALDHQVRKSVKVPGFRNSSKAPVFVKVLPTSKTFEKNPGLVAALLSCWAEYQSVLRDQVYQILVGWGWKTIAEGDHLDIEQLTSELLSEWPVFPIKFDRTKLPGFYTHWPKDQDFEALYKNHSEHYPEAETSIDKVSLMAVWLSMRLPYHVDGGEELPPENDLITQSE